MPDPLSLPAGVAGIISLGLQVTQGIVTLCSAWKGYREDMENLRNKTTGLANLLTHLDHVLRKTSSSNAFTSQVADLLDCSKVTMQKLDKLRAKLPTPATDKDRGIKQKITYPFEKQTILEMRSMIDSLQGNIDTALNILQVHQGTRLLDDVATHTALSLEIRDQLADHRVRLENLETMLRDAHNQGYMVAPSLLRSLHEDRQNLMDSNGPNSNSFGGQTSSTTVLKSRRGILQDVQRGKSRERLIVNERFRICSKLLQLSLTVSLAITKGAGGYSISPMIAYRSFRDFDKMGLLEILDTRELLPALKLLYKSGKAIPTDVTEKGETMVHWISNTLYGYVMFEHNSNMLHQAINYLVQEGVPMDIPTDWNQTALDCLLGPSRSYPPGSKPPVQHRLISDMVNAGCYITDNALNPWNRALIQYIVLHYPEAASVSYPALVILQKAERELVSLVGSGQLSGNYIIGNYTALQLATGWPAGIKILLDAGADMTRSGTGNAMDPYNGWCCNPLRWVIPSDCPASLLVFLRAGAALQPTHIGYAVTHSTPEMVDILVDELIRRRQTLRELAFTALPTHIRDTLHLSHDVLPDANAPRIFDALRDAGISMSSSMDPRGWHRGNVCPEYGTIFHQGQLDRQLMDRLYDAGFVDVDALNSAGYSPLMIIAPDRPPHVVIERANWLVDKGADMTRCLPRIPIPIIHVMTNYATWNLEEQARLHCEYPEDTESSSSFTPDPETIIFLKKAFTTDLHYACNCSCSPEGGCTPLSIALRVLFSPGWPLSVLCMSLPFLESAPITLEAAETVVRLATFTDLDLTHTCCRATQLYIPVPIPLKPFDPDEAERICDEQAELTAECDQLVASFMQQYQRLEISLMQFLREYWCPQMQGYLRGGVNLDEGCSTQLHDLGITLSPGARLHSDSLCVILHPKVTEDGEERGKK